MLPIGVNRLLERSLAYLRVGALFGWQRLLSPPTASFLMAAIVLFGFFMAVEKSAKLPEITLEDYQFIPSVDAPTPLSARPPVPAVEEAVKEEPWLEYRIRRHDTMVDVLQATKANAAMHQYMLTQNFKSYRRLRLGDTVYFRLNTAGDLKSLLYKTSADSYLTAFLDENGIPQANENPPVLRRKRLAKGGAIDSSLFVAADAAGLSDSAINQLIEVLEVQIDFYRDVRKGDRFRVIYEESYDEFGESVKTNRIEAFEYYGEESGRLIQGVLRAADTNYYTPEGESFQRAFLAAPLRYKRISSKFTRRRFHPILKRWRSHRGVDYAAASGTSVRSTADGVVVKVARERGYGRVVMIKHFNIYTTVYAHLRAFAKGIRKGKRVQQGDKIGYVGQSGLATGPHLHYEFRVRGKHRDPLSVDLPRQLPPLTGEDLRAFQEESKPLLTELASVVNS